MSSENFPQVHPDIALDLQRENNLFRQMLETDLLDPEGLVKYLVEDNQRLRQIIGTLAPEFIEKYNTHSTYVNSPCKVDERLATILGLTDSDEYTINQITNMMVDYLHSKQLITMARQNNGNSFAIIECDPVLKELFKVEKFTNYDLQHLLKPFVNMSLNQQV